MGAKAHMGPSGTHGVRKCALQGVSKIKIKCLNVQFQVQSKVKVMQTCGFNKRVQPLFDDV